MKPDESLDETLLGGAHLREGCAYHLSARPLGAHPVLTPRGPRDPMPGECRTVRRISVAPTLAGAWRAVRATYYATRRWWVYETHAPAVPAHGVPDARVTGERWCLRPARFDFGGVLTMDRHHVTLYRVHARRADYQRRVARAHEIITAWRTQAPRGYVSFSGGKDSTALLGLCADLGCTDLPVVTQADDLDWPEKRAHCHAVVAQLGFADYTYAESAVSALDQLTQGDVIRGTFSHVLRAYAEARHADGTLMGLRAEESIGRRIHGRTRGALHRGPHGWAGLPLLDWRGLDVCAYLVTRELPLLPLYTCDPQTPPHQVRMGWLVCPLRGGESIAGSLAWLRRFFPEHWARLVARDPGLTMR